MKSPWERAHEAIESIFNPEFEIVPASAIEILDVIEEAGLRVVDAKREDVLDVLRRAAARMEDHGAAIDDIISIVAAKLVEEQ